MNRGLTFVMRGLWGLACVIGGAAVGIIAADQMGAFDPPAPAATAPTSFILPAPDSEAGFPLSALALPPVAIPLEFGPTPRSTIVAELPPPAAPLPTPEAPKPVAVKPPPPPLPRPAPSPTVVVAVPKVAPPPAPPAETILISVADRRLRVTLADGTARSFPIAVGRSRDLIPIGTTEIVRKRRNPTWVPTPSMRRKDPTLPASVPPGPRNPMGLYALDLGWTYYRIHGTNEPQSIGRAASSGCFRMLPKDIEAVFGLVGTGTKVTVIEGRLPTLPDPAPAAPVLPETKAL